MLVPGEFLFDMPAGRVEINRPRQKALLRLIGEIIQDLVSGMVRHCGEYIEYRVHDIPVAEGQGVIPPQAPIPPRNKERDPEPDE